MASVNKPHETTQFGFDPKQLPGATRIGTVWLHVPPINIHFSNAKFEREMTTLRQPSSNYIKSGRGLWQFDIDLVFSGVNMINTKLTKLIAQIRRSPFTMMYNTSIQKMISYENPVTGPAAEIPIAVTGYTINTETNLPDTIIMRLSFVIFNYRPFLNTMQYMKQIINTDGTFSIVPSAKGIEDSNLYRQYIEGNPFQPYIVDNNKMPDFMFGGELEFAGTHTDQQNQQYQNKNKTAVNQPTQLSSNSLVSRIEPETNNVIRNASRIRKVSSSRYINEKQTITLGFHVFEIRDALDLRLGGYLSRLSQKWIYTESDKRADILKFLQIPDTGQNLDTVIANNILALSGLPAVNVASLTSSSLSSATKKYVKKFRLQSDSTTNILGIVARHSIPLSVLPVISNPVPTVQHLGGAASTITITIETNSERFIETLNAVDQIIEASARHSRRHSGSELTYVDNDIINLNGTFVVDTSDLDIQSKEDNPGVYIITYILREQAEVMNTLVRPASEIADLKRRLIYGLLKSQYAAEWQYSSTYNINGGLNLVPTGVGSLPNLSYLYLMIFPSWVRTIRNAFLQYAKNQLGTWGLIESLQGGSTTAFATWAGMLIDPAVGILTGLATLQQSGTGSVIANTAVALATGNGNPKLNLDRLMFEKPITAETDVAELAVLDNSFTQFVANTGFTAASAFQRFQSVQNQITTLQQDVFNNRALAYNHIWSVLTGRSGIPTGDPLYMMLYNFLMTAYRNNGGNPDTATVAAVQDAIVQGATELLAASDNRRWEVLLRSPKLLEYEMRLATGQTSAITQEKATGIDPPLTFTVNEINGDSSGLLKLISEFFAGSYSTLRAYPDLGLPFKYAIEDQNGNLVLAQPPATPIPNAIRTNTVNNNGNQVALIDFDQPSFYLQESRILPPTLRSQVQTDYYSIKNKVNGSNKGLVTIFGNGVVPSNALSNISISNSVTKLDGVVSMADMNGANMAAAADIANSDPDKAVLSMQNTINKTLGAQNTDPAAVADLAFGKVNSFKSVDQLFMNNALGESLGTPGTQTSDQIISEAQYEHKTFKSSLADLNPDLDHTVAGIIRDARERLLAQPRYYSINKAYPTFKFYFRIEGNPQWFLFDNFFDYRAIESIRYYKDKASPSASLHIVLNNYNEILTDYAAVLAKISYNESARNNDQRVSDPLTGKPLRSLFLEAGTQIQLKLGYDADPANLTTVFNGFITETSPGERYEIICQSYGAELFTDADMGTFSGWVCPPRAFIWWMLMNPKVKHLGTLFQPTILPTGLHDYLDGFLFDDNIYINQNMEPGKLRLLQVYNADNMNMWDVLQDIAAAHPGFICQTVPFDDRETIFFGRPDHFYKYTQDLGTVAPYYSVLVDGREGLITQLTQPSATQIIENVLTPGSSTTREWLNYMQWLPINQDLNNAMDTWRNKIEDASNGSAKTQFENLLEYCRWVEILQNLAADKNVGNIQYNISTSNQPAATPSSTAQQVQTQIASQSNLSSSTQNPVTQTATVTDALSGKKVANADQQNISTPSTASKTVAPVAIMDKAIAKNIPGVTPPTGINGVDPSIFGGIMNSLVGQPISLDTFIGDTWASDIALRFQGSILNEDNTSSDPLQPFSDANNVINQYFQTHDSGLLNSFLGGNGIASDANNFFNEHGIFNPLAILAWYKVGVCLAAIGSTALGNPVTVPEMQARFASGANRSPFASLTSQNTGVLSITLPGIQLAIGNRNTVVPQIIANNTTNVITFTGDVFFSDLKTHQSLRQLFLTTVNNISPAFQELVYFLGKPPNARRFRNYHLKTSYQHIVNNEINVNYMGMWNSVKLKYKRNDLFDYYIPVIPSLIWGDKPHSEFHIQAGDTLYDRITRETTVTVENARTIGEARAYATSILAEGIRNMYKGELVLLGDPEVKPTDVVFIYDDYNKMYGPVEVKSVTHVLDASVGFITIVEPQAYVDPLGVSVSPAQIIHEIFDTLLLPILFFAPEIGIVEDGIASAGGLMGKVFSGTAKETAEALTQNVMSKSASLGSKIFDQTAGFFENLSQNVFNPQYAQNFTSSFTDNLAGFVDGLENNGLIGSATADQVTPQAILDAINATRTTAITDLSSATKGEIIQGLKDTLGVASPAVNDAVDNFGARLMLSQTAAALKASAAAVASTITGISDASIVSRLLGFSLINTIKLMAVISPVAYYQMFAGMDDANYACPLRITPLSFNGSPYTAGLDGLTHQYGIWNHLAGQWRRFVGSVRTLGDAISEYTSGISNTLNI